MSEELRMLRGSEAKEAVAEHFHAAGLGTSRFVKCKSGEKACINHDKRFDEPPADEYGIYAEASDQLVALDVDGYRELEDSTGLSALQKLPPTLKSQSPHTEGTGWGHRFYKVKVTDDGRLPAAVLNDEFGKPNPVPSWGEVQVANKYVVGPGSQLDGCNKDGCERCAEEDGGNYVISEDREIATIEADLLVDVLAADPEIERVKLDDDTPTAEHDSIDLQVRDVITGYTEEERDSHPFHASGTGTNFKVDDGGETWRCFRHGVTGNALHLVGMEAGLIDCGDWDGSGLSSETWSDIFDYARTQGYDVPDKKDTKPTDAETVSAPLADAILREPDEWFNADEKTITAFGTENRPAGEVKTMFEECDLPDDVGFKLFRDLDGDDGEAFRDYVNNPEEWSVVTAKKTGSWGHIADSYADNDVTDRYVNQSAANRLEEDDHYIAGEETEKLWVYHELSGTFAARGKQQVESRFEQVLGAESTTHRVEQVLSKIRRRNYVSEDEMGNARGLFNVGNGVVDIHNPGDVTLVDHSPDYRFLSGSGVDYVPTAEAPTWEQFLQEVVRREDLPKLQEFIGYCLQHWTQKRKRALMLLGPQDSGKSTFLNMIWELLGGHDSVAAESLQSLTDTRWGAAQLHGRVANIYNDLNANSVNNQMLFKTLVGGEKAISAEFKNEGKFEFQPTQKLLFSANRVPKVDDADNAFHERWLHVTFPDSVPKSKQDPYLEDKLRDELPGILNWALEGLERLERNDGFTEERDVWAKRQFWDSYGASVDRFKTDCLNISGSSSSAVSKDDAYKVYEAYCAEEGLNSEIKQQFGRLLLDEPKISASKRKLGASDKRTHCYTGVTFDYDALDQLGIGH